MFSLKLKKDIEPILPSLFEASYNLFNSPILRKIYPEYLITLHYIIRSSVPLMKAAMRELINNTDYQPENKLLLINYFKLHIEEEMDHDVWLINDLKILGIKPELSVNEQPPRSIASIVGSQYYWIHHFDPIALLGYMFILEGYPPSPESIEKMILNTKHPKSAFKTLIYHADNDPDHKNEINKLLDSLSLTSSQQKLITRNAVTTAASMANIINEQIKY